MKTIRFIPALLFCLCMLAACGKPAAVTKADVSVPPTSEIASQPETTEAAEPEPDPTPVPEALRTKLDKITKRYGATGVQAAFLRDGVVTWVYNAGYADKSEGVLVTDETCFRCASLSKLTVAMTTMAAVEDGRLSLSEDMSALLGFSLRAPGFPDTPITPLMLLTHTSSVQDGTAFFQSRNNSSSTPLETLMQSRTCFSGSKPGARFQYSNLGFALMACGVELRMKQSFETLAQTYLFQKAGVVCSFSAVNLPDVPIANLYGTNGSLQWSRSIQMKQVQNPALGQTHHLYQGNLTISARDYGKLLEALLQKGWIGNTRVLAEESVQQILKPWFTENGVHHGLGIKTSSSLIPGRTIWCHAGSNFGMFSGFAVDPSDGTGAVVFTSGATVVLLDTGLYDVCTDMIRSYYDALKDAAAD